MRTATLLKNNLTYFWRTNLAVVAGVAIAVAVLAGALVVGDSVRASLRDLFLSRIGATEHVITSTGFFREQLADELLAKGEFRDSFDGACPIDRARAVERIAELALSQKLICKLLAEKPCRGNDVLCCSDSRKE